MEDDNRAMSFHGGDEQSGHVLAIETRIPSGCQLEAHKHAHGHLSILAKGTADVTIDGKTERFTGPCTVTVPANTEHKVVSVTPVVWYCLWADDLADMDQARESALTVNKVVGDLSHV